MSMLFPHLGPSTPTFRCTCCARRHRSSSSTSVRERLASANALAISGKRCEPGFPDAEPFYTYTAPPRIFFGLTILIISPLSLVTSRHITHTVVLLVASLSPQRCLLVTSAEVCYSSLVFTLLLTVPRLVTSRLGNSIALSTRDFR
jgi:hypothetical protein